MKHQMAAEHCFMSVCFIPLDGTGQKFFGFSEFLAGLALMVLAWTIADVRYRFRVRAAPIPLLGITFSMVACIGLLTLLTDLWRAEQWLVPKGSLLTPAVWQALLGGLFLATFLTWTWFAFIRPPKYGRHNAERFAQTLYRFVLKGSQTELAVISDELSLSAKEIVRHATDRGRLKNFRAEAEIKNTKAPPKVQAFADDLLLLIADKRLCRAIVESAPGTALAFFDAITKSKKYGIQIETFSRNVVGEALKNRDSFIFHEAEGYDSGLIGYHKPLSQAMFANYEMVETIGSLLDSDIFNKDGWDAGQWKAYCRVVLMTFNSYIETGFHGHSYVLYRAKGYIENSISDLRSLKETPLLWESDSYQRLRVVMDFIEDAVKTLDKRSVGDSVRKRLKTDHERPGDNFYDHLASMIFEVIFHAAAVTSPRWTCWTIQHNSVWSEIFNFNRLDGPAGRLVKFKVRRLLYQEIKRMEKFPNFKGAKILGFCLNVMGLASGRENIYRDSRALHIAVLSWTKKNFLWLQSYNPRIAEACLVDGMSFDLQNRRLVRTSPAEGLRREAGYVYFELDVPPPEVEGRNPCP